MLNRSVSRSTIERTTNINTRHGSTRRGAKSGIGIPKGEAGKGNGPKLGPVLQSVRSILALFALGS